MLSHHNSPNLPPPAGHYSQLVVAGDTAYTCGILPIDRSGNKVLGDAAAQMRTCLANLAHILDEAGAGLGSVVRLTVYTTDVAHWAAINDVCREAFKAHKPARTIVGVKELRFGFAIEIDAIASVHDGRSAL